MALNISSDIEAGRARIACAGRIAVDTVYALEDAVAELPPSVRDIEIDLSRTTYVSSAGMRAFMRANKLCAARSGTLTLTHPSEEVFDVLSMTGVTDVIDVVRSR